LKVIHPRAKSRRAEKNTFLSAMNPMAYTRPDKQKLTGLHLAALQKAIGRSFPPSGTRNVMEMSSFKRSVHRA
jgi:hypothetical protein